MGNCIGWEDYKDTWYQQGILIDSPVIDGEYNRDGYGEQRQIK